MLFYIHINKFNDKGDDFLQITENYCLLFPQKCRYFYSRRKTWPNFICRSYFVDYVCQNFEIIFRATSKNVEKTKKKKSEYTFTFSNLERCG